MDRTVERFGTLVVCSGSLAGELCMLPWQAQLALQELCPLFQMMELLTVYLLYATAFQVHAELSNRIV